MAIDLFEEMPNSREQTVKPPSATMRFVAAGTMDDSEVTAYALGATPGILVTPAGVLYRQDIRVNEDGHKVWRVIVPYGEKPKDDGTMKISFDTTGGTVRARASKATVASYPAGATNYKQLINVKKDGDVEGADISIPALKLTVEYTHPKAIITLPQIKALARLTAVVNSDSFLTFAPGEVLFLGATGSEGTDTATTVSYQFACSENATGLSIGDIAGIAKDGHDLIWVSYEDYADSGKPAVKPKAVYVERMYTRASLTAALGFGA